MSIIGYDSEFGKFYDEDRTSYENYNDCDNEDYEKKRIIDIDKTIKLYYELEERSKNSVFTFEELVL